MPKVSCIVQLVRFRNSSLQNYTIATTFRNRRDAAARSLLQTSTVDTEPSSDLPDLTAVQAVAALCARNFTAVQYVTALNERYNSGGWSCNNPWITYNVTRVSCERCQARVRQAVIVA